MTVTLSLSGVQEAAALGPGGASWEPERRKAGGDSSQLERRPSCGPGPPAAAAEPQAAAAAAAAATTSRTRSSKLPGPTGITSNLTQVASRNRGSVFAHSGGRPAARRDHDRDFKSSLPYVALVSKISSAGVT